MGFFATILALFISLLFFWFMCYVAWQISPLLLIGSLALVAAIILSATPVGQRWWAGITTKQKIPYRKPRDLVLEAKEIEEGIYYHPDGLYIARGPRGGLKVYKSRESAMNFRDR